MNEENHLILIAVGPVQEFIAAARKLRDLWYGSTLLSDLSKSVAGALHAEGCELVFPALSAGVAELEEGSSLNVANKILAVCPAGVKPEDVVVKANDAYRKAWLARCSEAQAKFPRSLRLNAKRFQQQVEDFGEFYAVWVPLGDDYPLARRKAEGLLAARKWSRCFIAPTWDGSGLRKSSLDGIRESVFDDTGADRCDGRVLQGEVLDALGAVKRFGSKAPKFEALADIAVIPWLDGVSSLEGGASKINAFRMAVQPVLDAWTSDLGYAPCCNDLFYAHNLEDALIKTGFANHEVGRQARIALRPLVEALGEPSAYACFLLGDGDHMGRALDELMTVDAHRVFSGELSKFATRAKTIVESHRGGLVYSGGDDVMAYLPLHTAMACADALRLEFATTMRRACPGAAENPTFSVGLVIVHHADDLGAIRQLAKGAERVAKDKAGRNALCVVQDKRGGGKITVFGKWDNGVGRAGIADRLRRLQELYEVSGLSSRLGYQLRMVSQTCGAKLKWHADGAPSKLNPANASSAEVLRVMGRKQTLDGDLSEDRVQEVVRMYESIRSLSDELVIARQLSQAAVLAKGKQLSVQEDE